MVVNWFQVSGNLFVHLFSDGKDQLTLQNQRFRGRTALFREQLPTGNASLQLTGVKVQDEGRYRCYSSNGTGSQESFINLKMDGMRQLHVALCLYIRSYRDVTVVLGSVWNMQCART